MLKRFLSYYKPHVKIFTMDMIASLLVSLIAIVYPMMTREMLSRVEEGFGQGSEIFAKSVKFVVLMGAGLLLLYFVRMMLNFFIQYYGHVMGVRMQAEMRSDLFKKLETLPYKFYDDNASRRNFVAKQAPFTKASLSERL